MKKLLIFITLLATLNTVSCGKKNVDTESPAPYEPESVTDNSETTLNIATTIDLSQVKNEIIKKMGCDVNIKQYPHAYKKKLFYRPFTSYGTVGEP